MSEEFGVNDGMILSARDSAEFRTLLDALPDPCWVYDRDTLSFLEVNTAALEEYGYTRDEFHRLRISDIRPPEDFSRLVQEVENQQPGLKRAGEWRHLCKDGSLRYVDIRSRNIEYRGKQSRLVIVRDITARRQAEEALRASEARFRSAFDNAPIGMSMVSPDGQILRVNPAYCRLLGYTEEEFRRLMVGDIMAEEDRERVLRERHRVLSGEIPAYHLEARLRRKDGTSVWVDLTTNAVRDENGAPLHTLSQIQDVTERKDAERALVESKELFRALTEHSNDIITILSPEGIIQYESPSVTDVLGYEPDELVGKEAFSLVHPEDLPTVREAMSALSTGAIDPDRVVYRFRHKDGSWRWLESNGSDQTANPAVRGYVSNSRDVTERVRLQGQAIQTEKLASLGELVAGVAHEINNPLTAISGYAQLLKMHAEASVQADAQMIENMVQRATRIVRSLQSCAPSGEEARKRYSLSEIVNAALDVVHYKLQRAEIALDLHFAPDLPPVWVNVGEIGRVVMNLLSNAEYALRDKPPADRKITIRTTYSPEQPSSPGFCVLTITDTGVGIPEGVRGRIFDPFFTTRDVGEGVGLGLYISHGIIVAHGGSIAVESQEGTGSTFTVRLPAAEVSA